MPFAESLRRRLVPLALAFFASSSIAEEPADTLERARAISYGESWQEARPMLDSIEHLIFPDQIREYAEFQLLKARHETLASDGDAAIQRMERLLTKSLPPDLRIQALHSIAHAAVLLRNYERAFDAMNRALALDPENIDNEHRIPILNMAAYMFGRVGETERALEYAERAIALAQANNDVSAECISMQRLAPVLKWAERIDDAEHAYRRGIETCSRIDNELFIGVLQHGLADLLRESGRLGEALELAPKAIEALDDGVFPLGEQEARLVYAETLLDAEAETISEASWQPKLDQLATFMREQQSWDQLARLFALRAGIAMYLNQPVQAVQHLNQQIEARERFLGHERQIRLAFLEVQFDTRLQQQEIELLEERARAAEIATKAAQQQQRLRTIVLLLAVLLVVLLLFVLLRAMRARQHYQQLSRHDGLTGLANHSWFFEHGEARLAEARQSSHSMFLVLVDIDHFKTINDRHGHQTGDAVLRSISKNLRHAFGPAALIGRLGGEEFGILTASESPETVISEVEKLQAMQKEVSISATTSGVALSLGMTGVADNETLDESLSRADNLLYQAKKSGRDRIIVDPALINSSSTSNA